MKSIAAFAAKKSLEHDAVSVGMTVIAIFSFAEARYPRARGRNAVVMGGGIPAGLQRNAVGL